MDEVVAVYQRLFGFASEKKVVYLQDIVSRWDADRVMEGLRFEHGQGATRRDICGRLEAGLKRGDKHRDEAALKFITDHLDPGGNAA
jgi:hypothetical protein